MLGARRGACLALLAGSFAVVQASPASAAPVAVGAYIPNQWKNPAAIDAFARKVGHKPAIVLVYKRWDVKPFYRPELTQIAKRGAVPMVSWEPWTSSGKADKLWSIARGRYDGYLTRSAREAREWGRPVMVRFAQEMNGSWAPWEKGKPGSSPQSYILAWRHIVSLFRRAGADNVLWVWCPNANTGHLPFMQYYPGDRWVDWVGLDGFNWGGAVGWRSFSEIFGGSYEELARSTSKPVVIAETGSGQTGGDKAEWVSSVFSRELVNFSRVRAIVWYNAIDRSDFRVASSPSALRAFRQGVTAPRYRLTGEQLLATPSRLAGRVAPIPMPSSGYGQPPLVQRLWERLHNRLGSAVWVVVVGALLLTLLALALLLWAWRRRRPLRRPRTS
jgi:mannan endo-1,4-beta-mannosidase